MRGERRRRGRRAREAGPAVTAEGGLPKPPGAEQAFPANADAGPVLTIDALGRKCPIPIIMLAERIREVPIGAVVAVLADDVAAKTDIPAWCRMKSQHFVQDLPLQTGWAFHIRRTY